MFGKTEEAQTWTGPRWETKVLVANPGKLESRLAEAAADGWEPVGVAQGVAGVLTVVLKRPALAAA